MKISLALVHLIFNDDLFGKLLYVEMQYQFCE